jgi:hypothetical protein
LAEKRAQATPSQTNDLYTLDLTGGTTTLENGKKQFQENRYDYE